MSDKKPIVFVTRRVPRDGVALREGVPTDGWTLLEKHCEVKIWDSEDVVPREILLQSVRGASGIFCTISDQIDRDVLDAAGPALKVVATMSVGTDHIDRKECKIRAICVANTPDLASDSAADLSVALILMTSRRLVEGIDAMREGEYTSWKPTWLCGSDIGDKIIGICGFGRVGFGIARRMKPFGVSEIIYNDIEETVYATGSGIAKFVSFDELVKQSDILCICCAVTPQTVKKFNASVFAKMKKSAIIINTSRGVIINHDDLVVALKEGTISAAGLDVTDPEPLPMGHPLLSLPNCVILPHMGTNTMEARKNMSQNTAKNILAVLRPGYC